MEKQKNKIGKIRDLVDTINLMLCSFFGIGFIYSNDKLFEILGTLFIFWSIFYVVYNRENKNG